MSNVTITVSGPVGSGKSALCKEIEILCRALGVPCVWEGGEEERNLVGGDSYNELAMYQPCVTLREALAQPGMVMDAGWHEKGYMADRSLTAALTVSDNTVMVPTEPGSWIDSMADKDSPPFAAPERLTEEFCRDWRERGRKHYRSLYARFIAAAKGETT